MGSMTCTLSWNIRDRGSIVSFWAGGLEAMWYGRKRYDVNLSFFIFPAQRWWCELDSWRDG